MPGISVKKEFENGNGASQSGTDSNAMSKHQRNRERRKELRRKRRVLESIFEKLKYDPTSLSDIEIEEGIDYFIELNESQSKHSKHNVYFHITLDKLRQELIKQNHSSGAILEALRWYVESHKQDLRRLIRKTLMLGQPLFEHNCTSNCKDFVNYSFFQSLPCIETINVLYKMAHPTTAEPSTKTNQKVKNRNNNQNDLNTDLNNNDDDDNDVDNHSQFDQIKTTDDFYHHLPSMTIDNLYKLKEKYCIPIDKHYKHYCGEINQDIEGSKMSNESILKQYLNKIETDRFSDQWYNEYKQKN